MNLDNNSDGWTIVKLGNVCDLRSETIQPSECPSMSYVGLEHIDPGNLYLRRIGISSEVNSSKSRFYAKDILYGKLRPYLDKGVVAETNGLCSTDILVIQSNDLIDPLFLGNFIHTRVFLTYAIKTSKGVNHPRTSWSSLSMLEFPLPPLREQHAIARALLAMQDAKEARLRELALERERKAALMGHLFTHGTRGEPTKQAEIGDIPKSWEINSCEQLCEKITVGVVVRPSSYYVSSGVPAFRSFNIREDRIVPDDLVYFSREANDTVLSKSKIKVGDVLIVRTGYPGTAAVVPEEFDGANCIDLVIARPNCALIKSEYLSRYLNSSGGKRQALASEIGLAQKHLNVGAVNRMQVPLPSTEEQHEIAGILKTCDSKIFALEHEIQLHDELFRAMLEELMTGRLSARGLIDQTSPCPGRNQKVESQRSPE